MLSQDPTLALIEKNINLARRAWLDAGSNEERSFHSRNVDRLLDRWLAVKKAMIK